MYNVLADKFADRAMADAQKPLLVNDYYVREISVSNFHPPLGIKESLLARKIKTVYGVYGRIGTQGGGSMDDIWVGTFEVKASAEKYAIELMKEPKKYCMEQSAIKIS